MARIAFGSYRFTTTSPVMWVKANPTMVGLFPAFCYLRISKNGVLSYSQYLTNDYNEIKLGIGLKTVELTEPGITKPTTEVLGCFIDSVKILSNHSHNIINTDGADNKILFLGDSITVGDRATYLQNGFAMQFRDTGDNVSVLGYGYGSIKRFADNVGLIADTVDKINDLMDGAVTNKLVIMLGGNDYAVDLVPVADFQTKYNDLLVAINTNRSDLVIKCVSPTIRTTETANANGDTLPDFRTAISNCCIGKSYCTYIDGSTLITADDLNGDGVHPSNDGHIALYNALSLAI